MTVYVPFARVTEDNAIWITLGVYSTREAAVAVVEHIRLEDKTIEEFVLDGPPVQPV